MSNVKILYVAFEYPPLASGGMRRSLYFANNLTQFGVLPTVITTDKPSFRRVFANPIDESLNNEVSAGVEVIRIPTDSDCLTDAPRTGKADFMRRFFMPSSDPLAKNWRKNVESRIDSIVSDIRPDAILVSIPPFSMAGMWSQICTRYDIPLIVDMRDAWSQWCVAPYMSYLHYRIRLQRERLLLKQATLVIATSAQTKNDLLAVHPMVDAEKINVITNGYRLPKERFPILELKPSQSLVIGYVGSFYYTPENHSLIFSRFRDRKLHQKLYYTPRKEDWLYRSPHFFFKSLNFLFNECPELRECIRVRFAGAKPGWLGDQVREFGLEDCCEFNGYLSSSEVEKFEDECDALLLTSAKVVGGRDYSIAGKTFEYFDREKPILGFVCEGAQKDILHKSGYAINCDPDRPSDGAKKIRDIITNGARLAPNEAFLKSLSRQELSRELAGAIRQAIGGPG